MKLIKYINKSIEQLDEEIEQMFDLSLPNSAFKRVIPVYMKEELRRQYIEFLEQQEADQEMVDTECENSRPVSTQVLRINISSLREAGYCWCPQELASACEELIRQQSEQVQPSEEAELNVLTEKVQPVEKKEIKDTEDSELCSEHETTHSKSHEVSNDINDIEKLLVACEKKEYPSKIRSDDEFVKPKNSDKNEKSKKVRTTKRKYFTKYMSNEFTKDTIPVNMSMMDENTQKLFREKEYNDLVNEITGMI